MTALGALWSRAWGEIYSTRREGGLHRDGRAAGGRLKVQILSLRCMTGCYGSLFSNLLEELKYREIESQGNDF